MQRQGHFETDADEPKAADAHENGAGTAAPPATRRRYRRRLSVLRHVRTGLADVIRELEGGQRDAATARTLIYGYSELAGVIAKDREQSELADRIAKLEETHAVGARPLSPSRSAA